MPSEVLKNELFHSYEKIVYTIILLLLWIIVDVLAISGYLPHPINTTNFLFYAIISSSSSVLLVLSMAIQVEPLVKGIITHRADLESFWKSEERLTPELYKRTKFSDTFLMIGTVLMLISFIFI